MNAKGSKTPTKKVKNFDYRKNRKHPKLLEKLDIPKKVTLLI